MPRRVYCARHFSLAVIWIVCVWMCVQGQTSDSPEERRLSSFYQYGQYGPQDPMLQGPPMPQTYASVRSIPPLKDRKPRNYELYLNSLQDHPKFLAAFDRYAAVGTEGKLKQTKVEKRAVCAIPDGHFEAYVDESSIDNDIPFDDAYTVFGLDCRTQEGTPVVAFILVIDRYGSVMNVHTPEVRAESVNMIDSKTVLFSSTGTAGAFVWNWVEDTVYKLPFDADSHVLHYDHSEKVFYGLESNGHFSPSIIQVFDINGNILWEHEQVKSHINYLSADADYLYGSLRSQNAIVKIDKRTHQTLLQVGGQDSSVSIWDHHGQNHPIDGDKFHHGFFGAWHHQHKGQMLSNRYYSLFDNHVDKGEIYNVGGEEIATQAFVEDGDHSRLVVVELDSVNNGVQEVFSFDVGEFSHIYGGADVLPSGNVLGSSYPQFVEPLNEDRKYHVNVWEVTPAGDIAWRLAIKGLNPWNPYDTTSTYSHSTFYEELPEVMDEAPVGWVIYNTERFYTAPVFPVPCKFEESGMNYLQVMPFNSIRTQGADLPGTVLVYEERSQTVVGFTEFTFQKSWIARPVTVPLDGNSVHLDMTISVENTWGEARNLHLGNLNSIKDCSAVQSTRMFYDF